MVESRKRGVFIEYNWFKYHGIIRGEDNIRYFVPQANHSAIPEPRVSMRVTFLSRPRNKRYMPEAYDVRQDTESRPEVPAAPSVSDIEIAAQRALELKRERQRETAQEQKNDFPIGAAVFHPYYGYGVVVSNTESRVSVRLNQPPSEVVEIKRDHLSLAKAPPQAPSGQQASTLPVKNALRAAKEPTVPLAPEPTASPEPRQRFEVGQSVFNSYYGQGVVVSNDQELISVRLNIAPHKTVRLAPDELRVIARPSPLTGSSQAAAPANASPHPVQTPTVSPGTAKPELPTQAETARAKPSHTSDSLGAFIRELHADVRQALFQEDADGSKNYFYQEPTPAGDVAKTIALDPRIADAFRRTANITQFYSHQVRARDALLQHKHVIISTPTASGKTEAYNPTILETLLTNPLATALYIFPLVALGMDQTERLNALNDKFPETDRLRIGIYNHNVPQQVKNETLRAENRILVTTPDSLHYIILPKSKENWCIFFRHLRYLVIDEAHIYKGVFGSNMANIIRRVLARSRREGNPNFPQIIISSATVRHPEQLARQLTGFSSDEFEIITKSGAPTPGRHFIITRSDIHQVVPLCSDLLNINSLAENGEDPQPISIIVFLTSINQVKTMTQALKRYLLQTGQGDRAHQVAEYYAEKEGKQDVLTCLRKRDLRCVFTTNALMAGIDIGSLDVAIVDGFPGLVMDVRQMFGRAGRKREGAVIFIADRNKPFDQFYFDRPEALFQGPIEDVVVNPENPILLAAHLKCAAQFHNGRYGDAEGPLAKPWQNLFGLMGRDILEIFVRNGVVRPSEDSYILNAPDPHNSEPLNDLRAMSDKKYTLIHEQTGQSMEEKRQATAHRDAHRNAIISVGGKTFRVIAFDDTTRQIQCQPHSDKSVRTQGLEELEPIILETDMRQMLLGRGIILTGGKIEIVTRVREYLLYKSELVMQCRSRSCRHESSNRQIRHCPKCGSRVRPKESEKVLDKLEVPVPPVLERKLKTYASWFNFPESVRKRFEQEFWPRWSTAERKQPKQAVLPDWEYAVHSVEHSILKAFPEYVPCDRDEIGGVYQLDTDGLAARVFIYDNFWGGLGYANELLTEALPVLQGALNMIERCTCIDDQGCPVCLSYFRCHNFNQSLSKLAAQYLLCLLLDRDPSTIVANLKNYVQIVVPPAQRVTAAEFNPGLNLPDDWNLRTAYE